MKEIIKKYLNQRNRNIISIIVIVLGIGFIINYCLFEPTYINSYIASNVYMAPANNAFDDVNFYKCVVDNYNRINYKSVAYTYKLSDSNLKSIYNLSCSDTLVEKITSVKGLEKLIGLKDVTLGGNVDSKISYVDVSKNTLLERLTLFRTPQITNLDVSNNTKLGYLYIYQS